MSCSYFSFHRRSFKAINNGFAECVGGDLFFTYTHTYTERFVFWITVLVMHTTLYACFHHAYICLTKSNFFSLTKIALYHGMCSLIGRYIHTIGSSKFPQQFSMLFFSIRSSFFFLNRTTLLVGGSKLKWLAWYIHYLQCHKIKQWNTMLLFRKMFPFSLHREADLLTSTDDIHSPYCSYLHFYL